MYNQTKHSRLFSPFGVYGGQESDVIWVVGVESTEEKEGRPKVIAHFVSAPLVPLVISPTRRIHRSVPSQSLYIDAPRAMGPVFKPQ